jgi:Secretion system C-terminal sorting domain
MKKIKLLFFVLIAVCAQGLKTKAQITGDTSQTGYIILAEKEAVFGKYNYINGNVGVRSARGRAEFAMYDILDPYEVRARYVYVSPQADVHNVIRTPAGSTSLPTFYPYNGNTRGLRNIDVRNTGTLNGNWNDVTVKRGVIAIITGNNFGKITVERGAKVTFTAAVINLKELTVKDGRSPQSFTVVNFSNESRVKVKDLVTIEAYTRVNVGGPEVTFYADEDDSGHGGHHRGGHDNDGGSEEKFLVTGEDNQVTANIVIPNGKLKVIGGSFTAWPTVMTGWYVIENLDAPCKFVYWNQTATELKQLSSFAEKQQAELQQENVLNFNEVIKATDVTVNVYPNPSASDFTIQVSGASVEPVTVRILDMNGKIMSVQTQQSKTGNIKIGADLPKGIYIAEVMQGRNVKTVKLVKLN